MHFSLLFAFLLLPVTGFAQSTCYSPSDCAVPKHCTSLDNGIVPGTCVAAVPAPEKKVVKPVPVAAPVVKKSASSSSSVVSSSSLSSSSSSLLSSSSSSFSAEDQSKLKAAMDSMLQSMTSMMNSMKSMFSGMMNSFKCIFGCKE